MTPLEFMIKQLKSERESLEKAIARDARKNVLRHIKKRIGYYEVAVAALSVERCKDCKYYEINRPRVWEKESRNAD